MTPKIALNLNIRLLLIIILNRVAMGQRRSCFTFCLLFFDISASRPKLPLGHNIGSWSLNHAAYDVYLPKVVETVIQYMDNVMDTVFFIVCKIYFRF